MRILLGVIVGAIVAALMWLPAQAVVPEYEYEGVWVNPDQNKLGLKNMVITSEGARFYVQAWENCHPKECDWGKVEITWLAPSVISRDYTHAFAKWDLGLRSNYLLIQKEGEQLRIQTINIFWNSEHTQERSSYRDLYLFHQQ